MTFDVVGILFKMIAFLFASACTNPPCLDRVALWHPTARMLGRVSLNPIRHIDPIGTILLPIVAAVSDLRFWVGEADAGRSSQLPKSPA